MLLHPHCQPGHSRRSRWSTLPQSLGWHSSWGEDWCRSCARWMPRRVISKSISPTLLLNTLAPVQLEVHARFKLSQCIRMYVLAAWRISSAFSLPSLGMSMKCWPLSSVFSSLPKVWGLNGEQLSTSCCRDCHRSFSFCVVIDVVNDTCLDPKWNL